MNRLACGLALGFVLGMHARDMNRKYCLRKMYHRALKKVGL